MKTISFHKINAPEADYLYVQTSQLQGAGSGLFTAIDIYKDEMIAVFKGELLDDAAANERVVNGADKYFIMMPNGTVMDSMPTACFAKYANDAVGFSKSDYRNNANISFDDDNQIGLIAKRKIAAGEEIFCGYGAKYWKKHR